MLEDDPLDLGSVDREIRENEKRQRAGRRDRQLPAAAGEFWQERLGWQHLPDTTTLAQLERAGYRPPPPEELADEQISAELVRLLSELAGLQIFFTNTNHLSDRQLYEVLWHDCLQEPVKDVPPESGLFHYIDLLGDCSEENIAIFYKYYADKKDRQEWMKQFPDYELPPHADPPYDRDRSLPRPAHF